MRILLPPLLVFLAAGARAEDDPRPVDVGKVLRESKEFRAKCKEYNVRFEKGVVRADGEIHYRGGGPCEYLVGIYPAKAHETIVLLDKGPWEGEGRRPRAPIRGMAEVLNNALLAAGFPRGKPFSWDDETGETFAPEGEIVHLYAEWKDKDGTFRRARLEDWLWNFKRIDVMQRDKLVYTGSVLIEEGDEKWLGAEADGLIVAILNTSTALVDNTEDGALDNGAYEAIPIRIPPAGTRVTVAFSRTRLEVTEKYPPLKLSDELKEAQRKKRAEEAKDK